jgi:hypothetical protein
MSLLLVAALLLAVFRLASSDAPRPVAAAVAAMAKAADGPRAPIEGERLTRLLGMRPVGPNPSRHTAPPLRLRGTMVSGGGLSLAVVDGPDGRASPIGEGSRYGGWVLRSIDHKSVELAHDDGERLVLELGAASPQAQGPHSVAVSIARSEIANALSGVSDLGSRITQTTRVVPAPGGGFRLFFPQDSPLRAYQLEPGDVIRAVNDQPVTPDSVLSLYGQWRTLGHVTLGIERRGEPLTLLLDVH